MRSDTHAHYHEFGAVSNGPGHARPALIISDSAGGIALARSTLEAGGHRVADAVGIAEAAERLERQASLGTLWIELERDHGAALDSLLSGSTRLLDAGAAVIVSARSELVDPIVAAAQDERIAILLDADAVERTAALAIAGVSKGENTLHGVASERQGERLRQLSDEVGRIAATLARLSTGPDGEIGRAGLVGLVGQPVAAPTRDEAPEVSLPLVRSIVRARRLRSRFFEESLFADPAWDMLLDLLQAEIAQVRVPVSSLCIAAAVPATTALRWIKTMTDAQLFVRRPDPHDGRRVFIELAPQASLAMRRYFSEVGRVTGI